MADSPRNDRRRGTPDRRRGGLGGPRGRLGAGPLVFAFLALLALMMLWGGGQRPSPVTYSELKNRVAAGQVERVIVGTATITAIPRKAIRDSARVRQWSTRRVLPDETLVPFLERHRVPYEGVQEGRMWGVLAWLLPLGLLILFWALVMRRMNPTQGVLTVGKSRARIVGEEGTGVTFADVAGVDEARQETQEVVEFLKNPEKFARLGA
ncbi:MAG TPA: ATP-dependent metallopeptidase FtsH/Yme1/Tma family protein, partial [Longimicrobiaceae bacterium]|nr:ATP-dependent metallopeptidase FtsH/Yme1/Tma family protein [Longimicrobiaceae bacterium]